MTTLVNIRCRELALTISREQCGAQVTRPHAPAVCRTCPVGLAHATGETPTCWPDGELVEEVVHEVDRVAQRGAWKPPAAPRYAPQPHTPRPRRAPEEPAVRGARRKVPSGGVGVNTWVYEGRELTAEELAALPGVEVPAKTIANRLGDGWGLERALRQRVDPTKRERAA